MSVTPVIVFAVPGGFGWRCEACGFERRTLAYMDNHDRAGPRPDSLPYYSAGSASSAGGRHFKSWNCTEGPMRTGTNPAPGSRNRRKLKEAGGSG